MKKKISDTPKQPAYIDELLKNGTVVLTANTSEELCEMIDDIPADVRYCLGAVGKNRETGFLSLRLDIVKS